MQIDTMYDIDYNIMNIYVHFVNESTIISTFRFMVAEDIISKNFIMSTGYAYDRDKFQSLIDAVKYNYSYKFIVSSSNDLGIIDYSNNILTFEVDSSECSTNLSFRLPINNSNKNNVIDKLTDIQINIGLFMDAIMNDPE